ncbi:MAG: acetylornithine deacetylase [Nitriliruptorales bacterium]|nr:acetylornithine deacetylase [Nitriliruptorales bacterium]
MDTLTILERLVAADTTSRTSNLALIEIVEELLSAYGVESQRVPNEDGTKAGLIARIGPEVDGGVVLSGHTDCVPVDEQPWSTDPFELHEDGGRLYGRGTADMKGFLAAVLAQLDVLAGAGLERPVILALSYDEELGTLGAPSLVAELLASQPRPAAVVVGEPTSLQVVNAHKGVRAFTTTVHGLDAHSSQPQRGANAIAALARVATAIDDLATRHREAAADPDFEPPYTTFNLATIQGGQAINIIPRRAEMTWEYRPVPADDNDAILQQVQERAENEVLPRLRATHPDGAIEFTTDALVPTLAPEEDGAAEALVRDIMEIHAPAETVAFGTDGGHFQAAGLSTVVFGPGSIDQAHQPDEYIAAAQLERFAPFIPRLASRLESESSD